MGEGVHKYGKSRRATERGYTERMARNITGTEQEIRKLSDEQLHVFNTKGNKVMQIQGEGAKVNLKGYKIPENSIITHNHPRALGKSGIMAIGNSFSGNDIAVAISNNAKEIRAVTPTYTFSIKRPKGGWGVSVEDFAKSYNSASFSKKLDNYNYIDKRKGSQTAVDRANITHYHTLWKELSKKYGWDYSKTKG